MRTPKKHLRLKRETVRHLGITQEGMKGLRTPKLEKVEGGSTALWFVVATAIICPLSRYYSDSHSFPDPPPRRRPQPNPGGGIGSCDLPCMYDPNNPPLDLTS